MDRPKFTLKRMALFIDPPVWPAHGTVFSHLITNSDLTELHSFAATHNISERAFDLDHYDVPAHLYDQLVAGGAQPVSGGELTRILQGSGLRIPLKERPSKIRRALLERWERTIPGQLQLGKDLLERWEEPHRSYHNSAHLLEMLGHLDAFYSGRIPRPLALAAWFHDAAYKGTPGNDERRSAQLAATSLAPLIEAGQLQRTELDATLTLIEATVHHTIPLEDQRLEQAGLSFKDAELFLDADVAILAADEPRYRRYCAGVRTEYGHIADTDFRQGRARILTDFLGREKIYLSQRGQVDFEQKARQNMARELAELHEGKP